MSKCSMLYTAGSSTYMVSEYASTDNLAAPTIYACNATVTLPQATTTVYISSTDDLTTTEIDTSYILSTLYTTLSTTIS